jgi:hypothetical protein
VVPAPHQRDGATYTGAAEPAGRKGGAVLTIDDITYDKQSAAGAKAMVFQAFGTAVPKEGTPQRAVLGSLAFVTANDAAAFELQDVRQVYADFVAQATQLAATTATARARCQQNMDHGTTLELDARRQRQATTLEGLRTQGTIVITRGTNPVQARQILTHEASPCGWTPGNWDVRFQRK